MNGHRAVKRLVLLLGLLCLASPPAAAQGDPDPAAVSVAVIERAILPAYVRLSEAAAAQQAAWTQACAAPAADSLETLRAAYHHTADAWAGVFHWTFGPITLEMRRDRFYHWPERRNAIDKGLAALLSESDPARLEPRTFAAASVAVQGLPALERLLYDDPKVPGDAWACQVGRAIAANLADMAAASATEWRDGVLATLRKGEAHPFYFQTAGDVLDRLVTEMLTGLVIIKDQKILPVLGTAPDKARPALLEARRSGRFTRNLRLNLQAVFDTADVIGGFLPPAEARGLAAKQAAIVRQVEELPPFEAAVTDPAGRGRIKVLLDAVTALRKEMVTAYVTHLHVTVGFNSLDGD